MIDCPSYPLKATRVQRVHEEDRRHNYSNQLQSLHKNRPQSLEELRTGDGRSVPAHLKAEILREASVWIVTCLKHGENPDRTAGSSIYPAVQNTLLATRALGLGTTLTTRHTGYGKEVDASFGLPPGVHSYAILPIGWPMGKFGPLAAGRSRMSSLRTSRANPTLGCSFGRHDASGRAAAIHTKSKPAATRGN
jgi:nitroreductase